MGGHTVPAVLGTRAGLPALPLTIVPLYFELDGTFPNHEANPLDPANLRRPPGGGGRATAPTSGWPSTATPTAASSSTSAVSRSARARSPRWSPGARSPRRWPPDARPTVIHNLITLAGGAEVITEAGGTAGAHPGRPLLHQGRDGRRTTRSSAASTRRTTTSATSGSPTPACSRRCTCSRPSGSRPRPFRGSPPSTSATSPAVRSTPR